MNYCLEDGSVLVGDPADIHSTQPPPAESATVMLHTTGTPGEAPTPFQINTSYQSDTTNAVAVLPFANLSRSVVNSEE